MLTILLPTTLWGQVTITTDANGNGTIDDSEKILYMIQTNQFQSFYMIPKGDNVSTANIPNAQMLWYFLDAGTDGTTQYYYIVSNSANKYICHAGGTSNSTRGVTLVVKDASNEERCKFKLVADDSNGTVGFYNIDVKGNPTPTFFGLNKQGGSVNYSNPIRLTNTQYINDYSSKWKFIPYNGTFTWPAPPFTPSTTSQNHYYKIHNMTNGSYYVSSDASSPKNVTISSTESNNMVWYFKEASTDSWIKYYYIVNPLAGEYMYYQGTATNGSDQSNAIIQKAKTSENEDRFQFIIVQTARVVKINNVDTPVEAYTIIPKLLKDKYWNSSCISPTSITEGNALGIKNGRGADNNNSHWLFESTTYVATIDSPIATINCDNSVSLTCPGVSGASIRYTTDGTTTPTNTVGTLFDPEHPFTPSDGATIMAVSYIGDLVSDVLTTTYHPAYSVAPTITFTAANNVAISYATTATIYYNITEDGSTPATPTTSSYTGTGTANTTLNVTIDPTKETRISAIAKAGSLNVSCEAATGWQLPQPTCSPLCDDETLTITSTYEIYYTTGPNPGNPEPGASGTIHYTEPISNLQVGDELKIIVVDGANHTSYPLAYTHTATHTAAPTIVMTNATTITITGPSGSIIYYTIDGDDPVIGASGVQNQATPVTIGYTGMMMDIRAIAKTNTLEPSCVTRLVTIGKPTITISADECTEPSPRGNVVNIPIPDDCTIWYAVTAGANSAAPDVNATPNPYSQYTGNVVLDDLDGTNTHYTVHAYARSLDGAFNSPVSSTSREMKTGGKPELTPPSGSNPVVGISGGVFGDKAVCSATGVATQQITIASDGTAEYTIAPEATGTLTVAFKHGNWLTSCEATYTLPSAPATPTWSQDCGNLLTLSCATPMADIHYTTNDTEPTLESLTYVAGCLDAISVGTIIRAKAFLGFRESAELGDPGNPGYTYQHEHVDEPTFYIDGTSVTITGPTGATVYYTYSVGANTGEVPADPADPTTSDTPVSGPITIAGGNIITVFKAIAIPADPDQASCVVRVVTREGYSISSTADLAKLSAYPSSYFFLYDDINASGFAGTVDNFTGVLDGNYHTISNLGVPLFNTITSANPDHNAAVLNVMLKNVSISTSGNAGAIANNATGYTRIYNCGILPDSPDGATASSVSGSGYVGGLVGFLDGSARVVNCFSYANIGGGTHRAGIVGYNNVATKSSDIAAGNGTMVMNCMFYGDITTTGNPTQISPVYGGQNIHNRPNPNNNNDTGLNNYCYFYYNGDYVNHINNDDYHGSLGAEERFLNRFEFFRMTLNSTRDLAAFYVYNSVDEKDLMAKWVLDKSIAPYPILKAPGYYPSIVNHDAENASPIDPDHEHYNEGRKLGTLTVNIQMDDADNTSVPFHYPVDNSNNPLASISQTQLSLNVTDKDFDHDDYTSDYYDFNYKKVQLPYYNQVGEGNYTNNRVVTGWKIVKINGSDTGTGNFTTATHDYPDWNFVDRTCSNKDLYSVSNRVFNQGAYWEVPDGVTSITIEPYWAKAVYLSDANYDVTYDGTTKYNVTVAGTCPTTFNGQTVYNTLTGTGSAMTNLAPNGSHTVYDYAVVLVGNFHQCTTDAIIKDNTPVTFMSADTDGDCEPDNTLFYYHSARKRVSPIRFDFLNIPGVGMVKRTWNSSFNPQPGIFKPSGWFEVTNTVFLRCGQFEYADGTSSAHLEKLYLAPLILQGGVYEQFVSAHQADIPADKTNYILIGGNSWFKNFANGCHTANPRQTPKVPISVAGGDYENFYLTGIYQPSINPTDENVVCYIDGGRFSEVAGAGMQRVDGNATWVINAADMEKFFGGGINPAQSIQGDVTTTISNSRVTEFYGGPKFGEMQEGMTVTTTATNCHFGLFFGAGHGGTAYNRVGCEDVSKEIDLPPWSTYVTNHYKRGYETTHHSNNGSGSNITVNAISTSYDYEFILHSDGTQTVARFFVNFAALSLAKTKDVVTNLTGCTIGTFYGGGRLGAVEGNVNSTLTDCTVEGDVFGSGFSAETPSLMVMDKANFTVPPTYNRRAGVFNDAQVEFPASTQYLWKHTDETITTTTTVFEDDGDNHYILTNENLNNLGAVLGNTTLTINGNRTVVWGDVYGGGALSSTGSDKTIQVNINEGIFGEAGATTGGNIYGGGKGDLASLATTQDPNHADIAVTEGNVQLKIGNNSQSANSIVINGNVYGCNNYNGSPQGNVSVDVYVTKHNSSNTASGGTGYAIANVFGGGHLADYTPEGKKAYVTIHGCENTIGRVFGGGDAAAAPGVVTVIEGGRYDWVFGGGNGEVVAANIGAGGADISVHGGTINHLFGGSNERGTIDGAMVVNVDNTSGCGEYVDEFFGGCNLVDLGTQDDPITLSTTIGCGTYFGSVYGGSNKADIYGDVTLTIEGGEIENVYGGSKGVAVGDTQYPQGLSADISGNVTLNLEGGTIANAFGGSNVLGSIGGQITVNVEDAEDPNCPLILTNVFGGGNLAVYGGTPAVNVKHGTVGGNVYGGGNGDPTDSNQTKGSTGAPTVTIGDDDDSHKAVVVGDVYGGGNAAKVTGNVAPTVQVLNKCNTEIGYVYGGGNAADVPATNVTIAGGTIHHDVFGGGHGDKASLGGVHTDKQANVDGNVSVSITGAKVDRVFAGANLNGSIGGTMTLSIDKSADANCNMIIREVYGGGNMADGDACPITIGCTGSIITGESGHVAHPENIGTTLEGIGTLYGGANAANIGTSENHSDITVDINSGIVANVFGGNNTSGTIHGTIQVNIDKTSDACGWYVGNVYGGGNLASYTGSPQVNILNGLVTTDVYGGGLGSSATVTGNPVVTINGGSVGNDVFGGGSEAAVNGATYVTVTTGTIGRDVYGGGALANTGATTVDILGGTITRDVYGGGLGDGSHSPKENGLVTVNIGEAAGATSGSNALTEHSGNATIGGNVYGCNNSAGSPQDDVTVNIYGTAHTEGVNTISDNGYAIANVFGGGNAADYAPENGLSNTTKKATVHVYGCQNTIERVFGGGNAAATASVVTDIQGGHISTVFGGGNGELGPSYAANVNGTVNLNIHGGNVGEFYGGSNQNGTITGQITTVVDNEGPCPSLTITEFFCGGNFVDITTDLTTTIDCSDSHITYLYGGCNQANITGNVTLNLCGGTYEYVFGGSKGRAAQAAVGEPGDPGYQPAVTALSANITGNVTLNLYGGTITNVFGGSNVLGNITGTITVNVLDNESTSCPLIITNIYGGSNLTDYQPTDPSLVSPIVNVVHAKYGISGNVYGGSKGEAGTTTTVKANPRVNIGYEPGMTLPATYNPASYSRQTTIQGNVFGGGDAAKVEGNTEIHLNKHSKVLGNVYGGGNMGQVNGSPRVIVNGNLE